MAESCREQVCFEPGFKQRKGRRISEIGWQRVPDRRCKKAGGTLSERFGVALWDFESYAHRVRENNLVESRQKSGRQKWLSCTVVGI